MHNVKANKKADFFAIEFESILFDDDVEILEAKTSVIVRKQL